MSDAEPAQRKTRWSRPVLERNGPKRTASGLYRTAEGSQRGIGGVPLTSAEDAVVAAVRMAYDVAETQVERSRALADRLRNAGDRAVGSRSDRKALDATEHLIFRAMMSGLSWVETVAAEGDNPWKRLMITEYRLLGSLLGLTAEESESRRARDVPESTDVPQDAESGTPVPARTAEVRGLGAARGAAPPRTRIILKGTGRRHVTIRRWDVPQDLRLVTEVEFVSAADNQSDPLPANLRLEGDDEATLEITTRPKVPGGPWKAVICDNDGTQIGIIEIEL